MAEHPIAYRVTEKRQETGDTWTLWLEPANGEAADAFTPGQFAMLYSFGAGEVPISLSALDGRTLVHTIRAVGAVTRALCATEPGEIVGVRGPFGTTWPLAAAAGQDVVIITGGIGLPPLRPVIRSLLADRARYGRINVLYGARSPDDLLFLDELEEWRTHDGVVAETIVDAPTAGWVGAVGVVTRLIPRAQFDPANTVAMMCGPEVMMRFAARDLHDAGVVPDAIWVSLERSMKCATGHCGHCQLGPLLICRDGAVLRHDVVAPLLQVAQL